MAKKKQNFSKMGKTEWEAHFEDRKKLAAYYEKKGYNSLVEVSPQAYIVFINGRLWDVFRDDEFEGSDKWMCRDANDPNTYLDPLPTLKACRDAIASMRSGGEVTEVKTEAKAKKVEAEKPKFPNYKLLRDLDVEVSEDDASRENAEIVTWTCGHTVLGRQIVEVSETHLKVQLDYGIAWVPMSGVVLQSEYVSRCLSENELAVLLDALNRKLIWIESTRGNRTYWEGPEKKHRNDVVTKLIGYLKRVEYTPNRQAYGLTHEGIKLLSDLDKLPKKDNT